MPAARVPLPIANGFYKSESLVISHQECTNLYPHILTVKEGLSKQTLFGCPGIASVVSSGTTSDDANRGAHDLKKVPYFVNGQALYRLESDSTLTNLGIVEGSGRVSMADNGNQLMIIAKDLNTHPTVAGYIYDLAEEKFFEISDSDFFASGNPLHVRFVDGYFMCVTEGNKHIISAINDGGSWNALDLGTAESDPDPTVAVEILNNQPYIYGSETIEGLVNQPIGADYPFRRSGVFAEKGTPSPFSVIKFQMRHFFIGAGRGETPAVYTFDGSGQPEKISDEGIDSMLQRLTVGQLADVYSWAYAQKGFFFVGFVLPTTTIVFEVISGLWHERKSLVTFQDGNQSLTRYRVTAVVPSYGKLYVGDFVDGQIGYLDIDIYAEYGEQIRRRFVTQPFQDEGRSFRVSRLELTMESGVGNSDDEDPEISFSRSKDAKTFSTPITRKIGKVGEYYKRQIWRQLGRTSRFDMYAFDIAGKIKVVGIQLHADILRNKK